MRSAYILACALALVGTGLGTTAAIMARDTYNEAGVCPVVVVHVSYGGTLIAYRKDTAACTP